MEKKNYLMIIAVIVIFGIIMSLSYNGILSFLNIVPENENLDSGLLLSDCARLASIYSAVASELNRKNFCCNNMDLNNNGVISNEEYCAKVYDKTVNGNSAAVLCSGSPNYYLNYEECAK